MKILVTGGMGLIGHNVVARLEALGHSVLITDTRTTYGIIPQDELDYLMRERRKKIGCVPIFEHDIAGEDLNWMMDVHKPEVVMHLASFPRQKVVNANPQLGSRTMSEGLLNLLEASVQNGVKRFMYISSSMVYGDFTDDVTEDYDCKPQGQYGIMKYAGELLVKDYTRKYGMAHTIIRPSAYTVRLMWKIASLRSLCFRQCEDKLSRSTDQTKLWTSLTWMTPQMDSLPRH